MAKNNHAYGTLFTQDYLDVGIRDDPDWKEVSPEELAAKLRPIYEEFPMASNPNESTTEDKLIWPVLEALGWTSYLRQQNLEDSKRSLRPDGLLFVDKEAMDQANIYQKENQRYKFGMALVESKRWSGDEELDHGQGQKFGGVAAATQMLYYLRRADVLTEGSLQYGILTDGMVWRLYWQGARSIAEQYFQINLAPLLGFDYQGSTNVEYSPEEIAENMRLLRVFGVVFRRKAFVPSTSELATFHHRAQEAGKFYESRVSKNISDKVFTTVFPALANAIQKAAPDSTLNEVRDAALTLMYRLLFLFFAEDRKYLPVDDTRYIDYGLRENVRMDIRRRMNINDVFSKTVGKYWSVVDSLSQIVSEGDSAIGLPPYNGGLFDREKTPLLSQIKIPDNVLAEIVDVLSFDIVKGERRYINYMDLSVQHLGSIYERLLEYELHDDSENGLTLRPNQYARKSSGSYYTPDDLINLVISETLGPIVQDCKEKFYNMLETITDDSINKKDERRLHKVDPACAIMNIKVCDPAMGSGPFLVQAVDYITNQITTAMAEAQHMVNLGDRGCYESPLHRFVEDTKEQIEENAAKYNWKIAEDQLTEYRIVRRMVLKRCVYGVDKNEMAVELAKVSLWLHSFTVGAPLSFIDHHLRCGDSLFGEWVEGTLDRLSKHKLFIGPALKLASSKAEKMQMIDRVNDINIAETANSAHWFDEVLDNTEPLDKIMHVVHALKWMNLDDNGDKTAIDKWLDKQFGDPLRILMGELQLLPWEEYEGRGISESELKLMKDMKQPEATDERRRLRTLLEEALKIAETEKFFNWEVAYPGTWGNWEENHTGGFDAVIGNPPWDRIKFQQVEWLAARVPNIAKIANASERKKHSKELMEKDSELAHAWEAANSRAQTMSRVAREGGTYPLLSCGDINLYSLFVERSLSLLNERGIVGLLTPSGIASDKTASKFFRMQSSDGRLMAFYDFTNKGQFFPDVTSQFKFCTFIASRTRKFKNTKCAFFLQKTKELAQTKNVMNLRKTDYKLFNPNTHTMPVFKSNRDLEITRLIYNRLPVLVRHFGSRVVHAWPVKQCRMFDMTNDSDKFRTVKQLENEEGAWRTGKNVWQSATGTWLPLYVGKMFHQFDHRAASVNVNEENVHNPAVSNIVGSKEKMNAKYSPTPQYWVKKNDVVVAPNSLWFLVFRDIARVTDSRTMIASAIPRTPVNNKAPLLVPVSEKESVHDLHLLLGNLNSIVFDYVTRQKVHSTNLNWFIVEQLPVVPRTMYDETKFGERSASEIVEEAVLELTYTAHDMAPFAEDLGYVNNEGKVHKPFVWNEERRIKLRAKLDAVYFHLYGVYNPKDIKRSREDITYIYSTFPVVEREEIKNHGHYISRDLALAYCNILAAGELESDPVVGTQE